MTYTGSATWDMFSDEDGRGRLLGAFLKSMFLRAYTLCVLSCPNGLHLYSFPLSQELQMQELCTLDLIYGKQKTKAGLLIIDIL